MSESEIMTLARAIHINRKMVRGYLTMKQMIVAAIPNLCGITLADAISAARIIEAKGPEALPDGASRFAVIVAECEMPKVYAWCVLHGLEGNG